MTPTGVTRAQYASFATADPRPSRFADPAAYAAWAARADKWAGRARMVSRFDGDTMFITPTPESATRAGFDARANRALRGTASGESMATWGPRYIREARAVLRMAQARGTLWDRVASR